MMADMKNVKSLFLRICTGLLTLLGFCGLQSCREMYGPPLAEYEIREDSNNSGPEEDSGSEEAVLAGPDGAEGE